MANQFPRLVRTALQNDSLQVALDRNAEKKKRTRAEIPASLPEVQELRQRAKEIRQDTIGNLDQYMEQFIQTIESNGFVIHHARTAHEARQIVLDLVKGQDTKLIVKSKTMVSEEIHLNQALEDAGLEVVETDLGEYIVQLRGEPPSHIVAPAIHLRREDVGQTFHEKLGTPYTEDIEVMNKTARDSLREKFLSADVGISGVNFGVAETGSICIITNEGNGRMVTTIPRLHIALMGVERLVPTHEDLDTMLRLLPRFATGQKLTSYVSLIQGPRGSQDPDGPEERHLILIDNGRQNLRSTPFEEALLCIRCGSCLDHCPVYREIGHLAKASTLCGACKDACPVDIDLPKLLLRVRDDYVGQVPQPKIPSIGIRLYTWIMEHPSRLRIGHRLASWGTRLLHRRSGWVRWLPSPVSAWTDTRDFEEIHQEAFDVESEGTIPAQEPRTEQHQAINPLDRFVQELDGLSVETIRCGPEDVADRVVEIIRKMDFKKILAWDMSESYAGAVVRACSENHIELHVPRLTRQDPIQRQAQITSFGEVKAGLTGAVAGFADTGTLVLPSSKGQSQLTSLLTTTHIAILQADRIFPTMGAWIETSGKSIIENSQNVVLVTGPSRTADIEMTLSIGVHGPGEVIVFIVE
jgi:L-lactate dehydrogenase complex protein LldF